MRSLGLKNTRKAMIKLTGGRYRAQRFFVDCGMNSSTILTKYNSLPDDLKKQAEEFIDALVKKMSTRPTVGKIKKRKAGLLKGQVQMAPDFDEPLEDFNEYQ